MAAHDRSRAILDPGKNAWKFAHADQSGVLIDAADYYLAFYEAAQQAKRTILLSGWQFDSGVRIVRGEDAPAGAEVRLLKFLDQLCDKNPELEIYVLAWDFHAVFALEREWMQKLYFHWATNERLRFRFDEAAVEGGSHHQKFAVIDRSLSFLGGIDLCEARWDDRGHRQQNPLRLSHGDPVKPYHDVQAFFAGCDFADALRELFADRWARAEGEPLQLPPCEPRSAAPYEPRGALQLGSGEVALSRTDPRAPGHTVREVEAMFVAAIGAAESHIYIETQYFSSRAVRDALIERMRQPSRPKLEIVVVLNVEPEAMKEELAIGLRQAKVLMQLTQAVSGTEHVLGLYSTRCAGEGEERPSTYIHSKLLIVDDTFLTVGSANLTNRSMGVDTELHAAWEVADPAAERERVAAIRALRVSLLAEHAGLLSEGRDAEAELGRAEGLVARLDALTQAEGARLCRHIVASPRERQINELIDPEALPFDPATPHYEDDTESHAEELAQARPLFVGGIRGLWDKLTSKV